MFQKPEERKAAEFREKLLSLLRDLNASLQSVLDEEERGISNAEIAASISTTIQHTDALRGITDRLDALVAQQNPQRQEQERRFQNRSIFVQWALFIATAGAFVAAGIYAHVASQQKTAMELQNMITNLAFVETRRQGFAVERSADAAISNARTAERTLAQMSKDSAASAKRAQTDLEATIGAARLDERPWLTVPAFTLNAEPVADADAIVTILATNSGKTPAIGIVPQGVMLLNPIDSPLTIFPVLQVARSRSVLAPNSLPGSAKINIDPFRLTADQLVNYNTNGYRLYLHAMIRYQDTYGVPHWTTVCAYRTHGTPLDTVIFCATGNDLDHNQSPTDPSSPP